MVFLGTAGCELYPSPLVNDEVNNRARELLEKAGKRAAFLLNHKNIVDFGPDVLAAALDHNLNFKEIENIFITHTHADHFDFTNLTTRSSNKKRVFLSEGANLWLKKVMEGASDLLPVIKAFKSSVEKGYIELVPIKPYTSFEVDGMTVSTVQVHHWVSSMEWGVNYLFEKEGKSLLYALDTDVWDEKNLEFFRNKKVDTLVMDATYGDYQVEDNCGHLSADTFIKQCNNFLKYGIITENTKIYASHISTVNTMTRGEYEEYFRKNCNFDITLAYDGLDIGEF